MFRMTLLTIITCLTLAGCVLQSTDQQIQEPNTVLSLRPVLTLPDYDAELGKIKIGLESVDLRSTPTIASLLHEGKYFPLSPSQEPQNLFLKVLKYHMQARGFTLSATDSNDVDITLSINQLDADIKRNNQNLYTITTHINVVLTVDTNVGARSVKNYQITHEITEQPIVTAKTVSGLLNYSLTDIIQMIANDNNTIEFIKLNTQHTHSAITV